jgi:hypothetical protein
MDAHIVNLYRIIIQIVNATNFALTSNVHKMQHNTQNYDLKQKNL